jgi:hypothetical protein
MEIQGTIKHVGEIEQVSQSFKKRLLVVVTEDQYPQTLAVEFTQDKVGMIDDLTEGQEVTVAVNLRGREWISPKGETRYFMTLNGWRVGQPNAQPAAAQQTAEQRGMTGSKWPAVPSNNPLTEMDDDLPF